MAIIPEQFMNAVVAIGNNQGRFFITKKQSNISY